MLSKIWASFHPAHVIERAFLRPQKWSCFPGVKEWTLTIFFHLLSPLIVTGVSRGEIGTEDTEHFPLPELHVNELSGHSPDKPIFAMQKLALSYLSYLRHR
jgi:hypothetical protein